MKFALFRKTIADAFDVEPSSVFIVGSAMAGRSLKGPAIDKEYSTDSDFDTLIISESLFTTYVMKSLTMGEGNHSSGLLWEAAQIARDKLRELQVLSDG
ncbi:MAG: hypothetical protein V9G98_24660 [Candidatus Competibacter sp.]